MVRNIVCNHAAFFKKTSPGAPPVARANAAIAMTTSMNAASPPRAQ